MGELKVKELKKEKIRKVFLEDLPRWKSGNNKGNINWKECIKYKIKFIYEDIVGEIEIIDCTGKYLLIKYSNNKPYKISKGHFQRCEIGGLLGKYTSNFKIELGIIFKDEKRDITIIDKENKQDENGKNHKMYKYKCNKCGYNEGWIVESGLLKGHGCSCCCFAPRIVVEHINSIVANEETHWMIPYFQGGYDEAKIYTKSSRQKIKAICPDCGRVKDKEISINNLYTNKSIGCSCGDGISYPEKFMFSVLEQLGLEFQTQLSKTTFEWCDNYKYDFYISSINLIIETDGGWHGKDNKMSGKTKEETKDIDEDKERLAEKNSIEVIRVDCFKSELEHIKGNILISELDNIFDLSNVDWLKCHEFALSNLVKVVCQYKKDNLEKTTMEIGKLFNLEKTTILNYLKKGTILGWCNYDPKEEIRKSGVKSGKSSAKQVEIFKDSKSLGVFESGTELERQSEELFGVKLLGTAISSVCAGRYSKYKGFTFKFSLM